MESGLNDRLETVTLQLQEMPQQGRETLDTTASARIQDPGATLDQGFQDVFPHVEEVETADSKERQKTLTEFGRCNCAKTLRRQTKNLWTSTWRLARSDCATSHHLKTCPYWNPFQEVWTTRFSASHMNLLGAIVLSASIRISKQAGIFSISPSLTLRGVVNESSPAFALFEDMRKFHKSRFYYPSSRKLEKRTSFLTHSVLRLFKERIVSPNEVDRFGRTLLHHAFNIINEHSRLDDIPAFRELIHVLLNAGVAINEVDLAGMTAFDYLITHFRTFDRTQSASSSVCELLANEGADMSDWMLTRTMMNDSEMLVQLKHVARLEPWQDVTQCGSLSRAVLRKSEQDVVRILSAKPSSIHELNLRKQSPLHLACHWPRGIQLLLDAGANSLVHQSDVCSKLPITYSQEFGCLDAIKMFLNAGSAFSAAGWIQKRDNSNFSLPGAGDPIPAFFLSTLQERRRKLFEFAEQMLPAQVWADLEVPTDRLLDGRAAEIQRVLVDADIEIPKSISVPQRRATLYHSWIRVNQANQLWDAGFRDIDYPDELGLTPIMAIQAGPIPEYAQWLLHHGADPHRERIDIRDNNDDKRTSVAGVTALHHIAYPLALHITDDYTLIHLDEYIYLDEYFPPLRVVDESSLTFEELLVGSDSHDDCNCACSSSGCTPFTALLKAINYSAPECTSERKPSKFRRFVVCYLESPGHPASSALKRSKVAEEVIRFETFEALQLSHTCCEPDHDKHIRLNTPEEVQEIHEEWEELLLKHEDLIFEFCHKFQELGGTITSFLEGYWQTRMGEVLKEENRLDEEAMRRLREIGVVLEEVSEESEGVTDEDSTDEDVDDENVTDED